MKKMLATLIAAVGTLMAVAAYAGPVNINTADEKTLETLQGVGPAKAKAIVEHRKAHGPFKAPEDIKSVDGIGDAIYEQNKDNLKIKD